MAQNPYKSAFSFGHNPDTEDLLYPVDNPDFALNNAMSDIGYNPYAANPFTASVRKLAPALGTSYALEQAMNPNANTPGAIARRGQGYSNGQYSSMSFSDYLRGSLTGEDLGNQKYNPFPGADYPTTGTARQNIGVQVPYLNNTFRSIRDYRNQLGQGGVNFNNLNPYMAALSEQAGSNGGLGTVDILSNLMSPLLGSPAMSGAYNRALRSQGEQAVRKLAGEGLNTQNDIWTYLLGI